MNPENPKGTHVTWPYIVLVVLLTAIGNNWSPEGIRTLGYVMVALIAVGYVAKGH